MRRAAAPYSKAGTFLITKWSALNGRWQSAWASEKATADVPRVIRAATEKHFAALRPQLEAISWRPGSAREATGSREDARPTSSQEQLPKEL